MDNKSGNSKSKERAKSGTFQTLKFITKSINVLKGINQMQAMRTFLVRANIELGKLRRDDPIYYKRVDEFNQAMILSTKAKWQRKSTKNSPLEILWIWSTLRLPYLPTKAKFCLPMVFP